MPASITDIRVNSFDPDAVVVYTGLYPIFSWDYVEDVDSTTQAGFKIRIGSTDTNLGTNKFVGDKLSMTVDSSVPYYEYPHHNLTRGRRYYVQIQAWDDEYSGTGSGAHVTTWSTFNFNVNTLPIVTSASITPLSPTTADTLTLFYAYSDDEGHEDSGTVIRWYKNNILQDALNDLVQAESKYLSVNDSWSARITPFDGLEYGPTVQTQAVTVLAADINIENIQILPADANIDDFLKIEYTLDEDPYLDLSNSQTTFEWYVNGTQVEDITQVVRLDLMANDQVYGKVVIKDNDNILAEGTSDTITIQDAQWRLYDLRIGGMVEPIGLTELSPSLEWKRHKSKTSRDETPLYLRVLITKTPSRNSNVFDSGYITYTKNSYQFSTDVLERGKRYFIHVWAGDSQPFTEYLRVEAVMAGSSWAENVENSIGWTIEFKARLGSEAAGQRQGIHIHDGTYFASLFFSMEEVVDAGQTKTASRITVTSTGTETYDIIEPSADKIFSNFQIYRVTGMGRDIKVFLNNQKVIDATDFLGINSLLKQIEFGDLNPSADTPGTWTFIRYSTNGPYDIDSPLMDDADNFDFYCVGQLPGGSIDAMMDNAVTIHPAYKKYFPSSFLVSWTPTNGSGQLLGFNEDGEELELPVVTKNYSPITAIRMDKSKNKYLATSKGVTVLYGSKHDPDYEFITDGTFTIAPSDFDQITNLPASVINLVLSASSDRISIDTTYQTLGVDTNPVWNEQGDFDPYVGRVAHGIFYFSQRTHGQAWFDYVDNEKGWQVEFTLNVGLIEQDDAEQSDLDKQGIGIYVNDGEKQEVIVFTKSRATLLFANLSGDVDTGYRRVYRIVGKGSSIKLYQRYTAMSAGTEQLLIDGTGTFTTAATRTGNSTRPRIAIDYDGNYHVTWHDDGQRTSSVYYSMFNGSSWSHPEVVIESAPFSLKNPDIALDSNNTVFVVYEDLSYGRPEISASIRDVSGWNPKIRITNHDSEKSMPRLTVDHDDNIHVVWQDSRNGKPEIFWCYRSKEHEAWQSSAQFTRDENIVSQNSTDTEMAEKSMSFKNPAVCYVYPKVYVAFEGDYGDGTTAIFISSYDVLAKNWHSSGFVTYTEDDQSTIGTSVRVSDTSRQCLYPDVAGLGNLIVIAWEDQTEPISQIWGNSIFISSDAEFSGPTKITNRPRDCKNPSVGFITSIARATILFESQELVPPSTAAAQTDDTPAAVATYTDGTVPNVEVGQIYAVLFSSPSGLFQGSATGYTDELILIENEKTAKHPHLPKVVPTQELKITYDYYKNLPEGATISDEEHPKFWLIGEGDIFIEASILISTVDTRGIGTVSSLHTKEFAFGDIDDAVGVQMDMRNISMYFGYDARPLIILNLNTDSVNNWPDNRVYDVYPDVYGNVLAATYSGLAYYNITTTAVQMIELETDLINFVVTAIDYMKNGVWIVGTQGATYYSYNGGETWTKLGDITNVRSITADQDGHPVIGTASGIYVVPLDLENKTHLNPIHITNLTASDATTDDDVKVVKVDDSNIIWAGTESGVVRIENFTNKSVATTKDGMRSNQVTDIAIIDRGTRYIATVTGIEKMTGFRFEHLNVSNYDIESDNVLSINYLAETKSLWFGATNKLYELTFRDPAHDAVPEELVEYESELLMSSTVDKTTHYILGLSDLVGSDNFDLTAESTSVLINKNPIDYGYSIDTNLQAVIFNIEPLDSDQVEVKLSNKFKIFKDFAQSNIEQNILGPRDTNITKLLKTPQNQLMALSNLDNPSVMMYVGLSNLPFALITLDREKPVACLQALEQLSRTTYRFKVTAADAISGVADMMLSNYENFTSDGTASQEFQSLSKYVVHDIGEELNDVSTEFTFPASVTINATTYAVGTGKLLAALTPPDQSLTYIYAFTTKPVIVFRLDPAEGEWEAIAAIANADATLEAHSVFVVNDILFLTTGSTTGVGTIYKTVDGRNFTTVGTGGHHIYCGVATDDGNVYFGSDEGIVYEYAMAIAGEINSFRSRFTGIGESVLGLEYDNNILFIATQNTGTQGCGFQIDLSTGDVLPMFPRSVISLTGVKIVGADMFVVAGDTYEIWRADYSPGEDLNFVKSFSALELSSLAMYSVPKQVLIDQFEETA